MNPSTMTDGQLAECVAEAHRRGIDQYYGPRPKTWGWIYVHDHPWINPPGLHNPVVKVGETRKGLAHRLEQQEGKGGLGSRWRSYGGFVVNDRKEAEKAAHAALREIDGLNQKHMPEWFCVPPGRALDVVEEAVRPYLMFEGAVPPVENPRKPRPAMKEDQ